MAGEREGKLFEAVVHKVLKQFISPSCSFEWNEDVEELSVEPDFIFRSKDGSPYSFILVTYCASAKESNRKGWRNIGETAEIKKQFGSRAGCLGITLGKLKPGVESMLGAALDAHIYSGSNQCAAQLERWIDQNASIAGSTNMARSAYVEEVWKDIKSLTKWIVDELATRCDKFGRLKQVSPINDLWTDFSKLPKGSVTSARNTSFRRGGFKLGVIAATNGAEETARGLFHADRIPHSLIELGWLTPRAGGRLEADPEISWSLRFLNAEIVKSILADFESSDVTEWVNVVSNAQARAALCRWIVKRLPVYLESPKLLYDDCRDLSENPAVFCSRHKLIHLTYMFPYELLVEVIRVAEGSKTAFGYSALERLCTDVKGMPPRNNRFYRIVLSDWVRQRGNEDVNPEHLSKALEVLLKHIKKTEWKGVREKELSQSYLESTLEFKILTYRGLDPVLSLLKAALPGIKVVFERSPFPEEDAGQDGASLFAEYNNNMIFWQSAQGSHTKDKKKELIGRLPSIIYKRTNNALTRKGYKGHFLILDGTWSQKDINALVGGGWTGVYYPDEIDQLAKAIV
jgi:hypothetical protein